MNYLILLISILGLFSCSTNEIELSYHKNNVIEHIVFDTKCKSEITHEQLRAQKEIEIELNKECDSIRLYFPAGGTVTAATLYKDSLMKNKFCSTPSFGIMRDSIGYVTISNKTQGKFYLFYGTCHWESRMWINFK